MAFFGLFGKAKTIEDYVNKLPSGGMTVRALRTLDFIAPGEWENINNFDTLIKKVTRESDPVFVADVKKQALKLWSDKKEGYQKALDIYQRVDASDKILGLAALADKAGDKINLLSFLDKITPEADTSQTIDFAVKVLSELLAFIKVNGLPGDGVVDFVKALNEYGKDSQMRMAALIAFDGLIPLGPDFLNKASDSVKKLGPSSLEQNSLFSRVKGFIPAGQGGAGMIQKAFGPVASWMENFAASKNLTRESSLHGLSQFIDGTDSKLDYLGAFIDVTTKYFEHTGTQSVASRLIERAGNEA